MVKWLLRMIDMEQSGLHQAALLLGGSALASQLLALLRDRLLAHTFGAGRELDLYYAAFRIPDLVFVAVGSFLAVTVLIPIILERTRDQGGEDVRKLMGTLLAFFSMSMVLGALVIISLLPYLLPYVAPGFSPAELSTLRELTVILLLSPLFLGLSNLFGAVTQARRRFFVYALAPVLYNLGIIVGVSALYPIFGMSGLAYGVALGAFAHFAIQIPVVASARMLPHFEGIMEWRELKPIVRRSLPRTLALGSHQLLMVVLVALASGMTAGSIAVFTFAFNLQSVPLALVGVSYSVAAFPTLARFWAERREEKFFEYTTRALRHIIFWSLPITALFIVLRAHVVRTVLGSGNFTWQDTRLTAAVLAVFAVSVVGQSIVLLLDRAYYAIGRTREPVVAKLLASGIAILTALMLSRWAELGPGWLTALSTVFRVGDVLGQEVLLLPIAFAIGVFANLWLLWYLYQGTYPAEALKRLKRTALESILSAVLMGTVTVLVIRWTAPYVDLERAFWVFSQGLFSGLIGIISGVTALVCLGSEELRELWQATHKRMSRIIPIQPGPEDMG